MTDALTALNLARDLLENVTPLNMDCGRACGGACCAPDEDGQGGMLLFPMEETLYAPLPEGFSIEKDDSVQKNGKLLTCSGVCAREQRPLACRLFPLLPREKNGQIRVVRDGRGFCVCPLLESGLNGFSKEFIEAVRQAGKALYACQEHRAFLNALHAYIQGFQTHTL